MYRLRMFSIWFLFLLVAVTLFSGATAAQDASSDQPADPAALPFGGAEVESNFTPDRIDSIPDWTMLTYQKLVDKNWDIYVYNKSGAHRVTSNKAQDQQPSLDRGTSRVAFVSDRSGDFDLYVARTSGHALRRILDTKSTIAFPVWSPDGKRIAIQAKVGTQYEVYVVDDTGRNLKRLTKNQAFDGMPAWSPDGTKLAFASNRSGDYRIYVMNADGSNVHRLSSYPNSLHPTWSPDGAWLAFDADVDGDGWQEVAVIEASGKGQHIVYNPGLNITAWAGSWAPDQMSVGFTEITAALQNGNWIWTKAIIREWSPADGVSNLIPGGKEWYMKWQTADDIPPATSIDHLPNYTKAENFVLHWSGSDAGGSSIKSYAVFYNRKDGSGWHTLRANMKNTQIPFAAKPGETVRFLASAIDNAFNQEPWLPQNIKETTFYETKISGTISDNRGHPLWGVPLSSTPTLLTSPFISGRQGHFAGYTSDDSEYTISIKEPNFKSMPGTTVLAGNDFRRDLYLMPKDTRIKNGSFEGSSSTPLEWTSGGTLPQAISNEGPATGRYSIRLGQLADAGRQAISQNATTASISQVVSIPSTLQEPTLSYMVRAAGEPQAYESGLRVLIQPAKHKAPVEINKISTTDWGLQWIDMSPWQGQQVTVTFEMLQKSSEPLQAVYLDDISLGSSNPDLWISLSSAPATALPGDTVLILLDYGNGSALLAENSVVELALPPELTLVSATPPYSVKNNVVRWNVGDLPPNGAANRLQIEVSPVSSNGSVVVLKAFAHSETTEAHMRNNISETTVELIEVLHYPLIFKR